MFDAGGAGSLRSFLLTHGLTEPGRLHADVHTVTGRATGSASFDLGALSNGTPTGQLTLLLTCDRPASYRWTLSDPGEMHDDPVAISRSGSDCSGRVIAAGFVPKVGAVPKRLVVAVPRGTRILIEVDLSRD